MKKRFSILYTASAFAMLLFNACSKKIDEAYKNPNADVKQPVETLLPNVISNMAVSYTAQGTNYGTQNDAIYIGRYVQYWATNTANNQYDQMGGATTTSDILGAVWAAHYYGMGQNLNRIIEWGTEDEKWDYVGVAHAIRAWSWLTLTDMYGEVIVNDAFNTSKLIFNYDEQEAAFAKAREHAYMAIDFLNRTGSNVSQANLAKGDAYFYNGDVNKWKKFAYSVLARSYHRLTNKSDYKPDSVIKYADLGINSNTDNAMVKFENTGHVGTKSFYGPFRNNVGALRQTAFIANLMNGTNSLFTGVQDPRAWYILRENPNGTFVGVTPTRGGNGIAKGDSAQNFFGGAFNVTAAPGNDLQARYIFKDNSPWPIITASEVQFMKAEALYLKGQKSTALETYKNGISLNFDMLTMTYNASIPAGKEITPASKAAYLNDVKVVPSLAEFSLSHIMLQKYIALYGFGAIETWVDMRRYHYNKDLENGVQVYRDFTPPTSSQLNPDNKGEYVYRARPRYNSEYLYNVDALNKVGAMNGNAQVLNYHTFETWFSKR
jgi:hypothetical protein